MSSQKVNNIFNSLYANRISVVRGETTIVNISLLFCILAALCAPWLVLGGAIAAVALGYKFSYIRHAEGFDSTVDAVVKDAERNVRSAVDAVGQAVRN